MFDFRDMLEEYNQPVTILNKTEGGWDEETGKYIDPADNTILTETPVLPLTNDDLRADEGGKLTSEDKKMYYHGDLKQGIKVKTDNKTFLIDSRKDYSEYASGLFIYILVRQGESA